VNYPVTLSLTVELNNFHLKVQGLDRFTHLFIRIIYAGEVVTSDLLVRNTR
jgi:hypothetical protein